MFLVEVRRSGPQWQAGRPLEEQSGWEAHAAYMDALVDEGFMVLGGPVADELRVFYAFRARDEEEIRATLARDPRSGSHLVIAAIEPWTVRLAAPGLQG
jgi:hypothetical protein